MRYWKRIVILGGIGLLMGSPSSLPAGAATQDPSGGTPQLREEQASSCFSFKRRERRFARKHNAERSKRGLPPLRLDVHLGKVARKHTWEMINLNQLHHTSSGTLGRRVTRWTILGENVGVGSTVASLHSAFMNSPSHEANILYERFRYIGVGTARRAGRLWVTVIFEAATNPGTTLRMC